MKHFRLILLLTMLMSFGGIWLLSTPPAHPIEEGANIFSSSVYTEYHKQLLTFLKLHPEQAQPFALKNQLPQNADEQRQIHVSFVHTLRRLLNSSHNEASQQTFLNDLTRWIYLKPNLIPSTEQYFYSLTPGPSADILAYLKETQKELRKDNRFSGLVHNSHHEDHYLHGNLPFLLFSEHSTNVFRMGTPLGDSPKIAWPWTAVEVYPEFIRFIEVQPSHLYVNLMKRKGVEGAATQTLEQLEAKYPNFAIVTLDKNSTFYWQDAKHYPEQMDGEKFKDLFHQHLIAKDGNYFWTAKLNATTWPLTLQTISEDIHGKFFQNRPQLNRQERLDYIELTYLAILDHLKHTLKPNSMNITCRQGMDRAPSLYVLWMVQKNLIDNREIAALLLAPPLLISNRPSHASRIDRFASAAKRLGIGSN